MATITLTDRDTHLRCENCDEVVSGNYDPLSGMLEIYCPKCQARIEAKLYGGELSSS